MISILLLGSTANVPGLTTFVGGSMVDDGQWHDVIIRRNKSDVLLTIDRLETQFETNGLFYRLDLDKMVSCVDFILKNTSEFLVFKELKIYIIDQKEWIEMNTLSDVTVLFNNLDIWLVHQMLNQTVLFFLSRFEVAISIVFSDLSWRSGFVQP